MKRILLIDDEEGIRLVWKRFHDLTEPVFRGQLEMDVACSLEQGRARMAANEYDAIILDHKMGTDNTEGFVAEMAGIKPPIIMLTGNDDIFLRRRCMMLGAADFWTKTDAQERPDLFFKSVYNQYLSRHASSRD